MITTQHLEIYKYYEGNGDGFARCSSEEEKVFMTYEEWSLLDEIIQNIHLVKKGLSAKSFSDKLWKKLLDTCDTQETINKLLQLAE